MKFSDLKMFVRSMVRNRLYSLITILGFSVALAFITLLSLYMRQELAVDNFHEKKDRIYRLTNDEAGTWGGLVAGRILDEYPEVEAITRISEEKNEYCTTLSQDKVPMHSLYVDNSFFDIFSFPIIDGRNFETKNEVLLTRSFALKVFGEEDPLGREIDVGEKNKCIVVGIVEDVPVNTHFNQCDIFRNVASLTSWANSNHSWGFGMYILEKPDVNLHAQLENMKASFYKDYWFYSEGYGSGLHLEPLQEVYWSKKRGNGIHHNSKNFVNMLLAIILVILILAIINYNNLSVARASFRAKESAVKKLIGSNNRILFKQYILESWIVCFVSFLIGVGIVITIIPLFNYLLDTEINIIQHVNLSTIVIAFGLISIIGIISGLIPAFIISRFNPIEIVKGSFRKKTKGTYGKVLICLQYGMSMVLIICSLVIWKQTNYMRNYDVGFDKENIIWLEYKLNFNQQTSFKNELDKMAGVQVVSYTRGTPLDGGMNQSMTYKPLNKSISFQEFVIDSLFFKMLDIEVIPSQMAYAKNGVWLNQAAVEAIESNEIPTHFYYRDSICPVLGIVNDFHIRDLHSNIKPLIIRQFREQEKDVWKIMIKIGGVNQIELFESIKDTYKEFTQGKPFESGFMDQTINNWYENEARNAKLVGFFSIVSIVLSMMGILAMATYYIQQRVKDIGIRRVNGATIQDILKKLMSNFLVWIVVAFVVACPLGWYLMTRWQEDFIYKSPFGWEPFVVAGGLAFIVAALMVGWQSVKAASENPINSLRSE